MPRLRKDLAKEVVERRRAAHGTVKASEI